MATLPSSPPLFRARLRLTWGEAAPVVRHHVDAVEEVVGELLHVVRLGELAADAADDDIVGQGGELHPACALSTCDTDRSRHKCTTTAVTPDPLQTWPSIHVLVS